MPSIAVSLLTATALVFGIFYQVYLAPLIDVGGVFRNVEPMNTEHCEAVEGERLALERNSASNSEMIL
jgi:hypothetical protein